jgi:hypothetical protein
VAPFPEATFCVPSTQKNSARALILGGFLQFQEEVKYFGARVLPLVREIEDSEEDSVDSPVLVSA